MSTRRSFLAGLGARGRRLEPARPGPRHPGHELALPPSEAEDHGRAHGAGAGARPPGPRPHLHRPGPDRPGRGDGLRGGDAAPHPGAPEAHARRAGPAQRGLPLRAPPDAGHLRGGPGRAIRHRPHRHRDRALGPGGQGARPARLPAARRQDAGQDPRLLRLADRRPRRPAGQGEARRHPRHGLHRGQDRHRRARRSQPLGRGELDGEQRRDRHDDAARSRSCASSSRSAWTSPSTCTAATT